MPIIGIETALYGVEDLAASTQFFVDFGLPLLHQTETESRFTLAEGSNVVLRHINDAAIPASKYVGLGVKETVWGVDSEASLNRLADGLSRDREVSRDADGAVHFLTDCGMSLGLRVFDRKKVTSAPDPVNAPGHINRFNQTRKWRRRALPKTLNHVVFGVADYRASAAFFRERLGFRLSDHQKGIGMYLRADGAHEHHNLFLMDYNTPGIGGVPRFHHCNFGVEDIDELMIGANLLMSKGYKPGFLGTGRHRISSALFSYWQCPAGGEAEYGADTDYIDDNWTPREWEFRFGTMIWMQSPPPFMQGEIAWDVDFYKEFGPAEK